MTAFWASSLSSNSAQTSSSFTKDEADIADTGLADVGLPIASAQAAPAARSRPQLLRGQLQPPPSHQLPPPPASQSAGSATDSLSLMQLRRIVTEFPRSEAQAYTFTYADTATYEEEVDEWFSYNDAEFLRLRRARNTFERRWKKFHEKPWIDCDPEIRKAFIKRETLDIRNSIIRRRCKSLQTIMHVVLGVWHEGVGVKENLVHLEEGGAGQKNRTTATESQLESIRSGVLLITKCGAITEVFRALQNALDCLWSDEYREPKAPDAEIHLMQDELHNITTILYLLIETTRHNVEKLASTQKELSSLNPNLVDYLLTAAAKLRWDDANELPQTRIFLLFWKAMLLIFGGTAEIEEAKRATSEWTCEEETPDLITASPLDYHIFRQEITSKYPAYVPPAPLLPLDLNSNTILPPLPNHPSRNSGANGILPTPAGANGAGGSILHQPVHIATPAPSPPPSPPVGGKAGKKQNYQTNQNFPFMYPPLDSSSNSAGGKGSAGLQELLVGRKWEGSDIPASILEAGELFAKRTRMTRATRQLWDERERFLKFERGWDDRNKFLNNDDIDVEDIDLDGVDGVDDISLKEQKTNEIKASEPEVDYGPKSVIDDRVKDRIELIEKFYRTSLPHLQSLVIVLLKTILANVTALIMQPAASQQHSSSYQSEVNLRANSVQVQRRPGQDNAVPPAPPSIDVSELPIDELEALRSREITAKAVSGILLILLKWFKISHILKFEYLTQLLLDANYLPLVLKLLAHQEIERVVDANADREDSSFFTFCNTNGKTTSAAMNGGTASDDDDAVPPPIKLNRDDSLGERARAKQPVSLQNEPRVSAPKRDPPEIDELGYPVNEPLSEPKTDFSWRNFFSSINYLRIMQKICKNKAHRNLLLVHYKSSNILKRALKVPQRELRLYTLKLFKNQVPYCGRKWRQGNMRVITAVYLHCKPELRDDWLAGSDVDAEVEEALPLEQALRALTHWHNIRKYPDQMGADVKLLEDEYDFFVRELDKLDPSVVEGDAEESAAECGWDGQVNGW